MSAPHRATHGGVVLGEGRGVYVAVKRGYVPLPPVRYTEPPRMDSSSTSFRRVIQAARKGLQSLHNHSIMGLGVRDGIRLRVLSHALAFAVALVVVPISVMLVSVIRDAYVTNSELILLNEVAPLPLSFLPAVKFSDSSTPPGGWFVEMREGRFVELAEETRVWLTIVQFVVSLPLTFSPLAVLHNSIHTFQTKKSLSMAYLVMGAMVLFVETMGFFVWKDNENISRTRVYGIMFVAVLTMAWGSTFWRSPFAKLSTSKQRGRFKRRIFILAVFNSVAGALTLYTLAESLPKLIITADSVGSVLVLRFLVEPFMVLGIILSSKYVVIRVPHLVWVVPLVLVNLAIPHGSGRLLLSLAESSIGSLHGAEAESPVWLTVTLWLFVGVIEILTRSLAIIVCFVTSAPSKTQVFFHSDIVSLDDPRHPMFRFLAFTHTNSWSNGTLDGESLKQDTVSCSTKENASGSVDLELAAEVVADAPSATPSPGCPSPGPSVLASLDSDGSVPPSASPISGVDGCDGRSDSPPLPPPPSPPPPHAVLSPWVPMSDVQPDFPMTVRGGGVPKAAELGSFAGPEIPESLAFKQGSCSVLSFTNTTSSVYSPRGPLAPISTFPAAVRGGIRLPPKSWMVMQHLLLFVVVECVIEVAAIYFGELSLFLINDSRASEIPTLILRIAGQSLVEFGCTVVCCLLARSLNISLWTTLTSTLPSRRLPAVVVVGITASMFVYVFWHGFLSVACVNQVGEIVSFSLC